MSACKLSICIATLNRAAYIGETLASIARQMQEQEQVEVVVLDGASTDNTEEVVRSFAAKLPSLRYFRQDQNHGVDADFDRAVSLAQGEYCWLMTDDDEMKPGAIATVLQVVQRSPSLVVVNAEVRNADLSRLLEPRRLALRADREYAADQMDQLLADAGSYLTFIGCVVIRRVLWLARDRASYYGSLFVHVGVIFQARLPGAAVVLAQPLIAIRYGNAMWRPKEFEIWMFKWPGLLWSLPLPERAKAAVCPREPWRDAKTLLFYRAKGTYSSAEYRRWLASQVLTRRERLLARAVALVPGFVANLLGLIYCSVVHRGTGMALLELKNSRYYFGNVFAAGRAT